MWEGTKGFVLGKVEHEMWRDALEMINRHFALDFDSKRFDHYERYSFFPKLAASFEMKEIVKNIVHANLGLNHLDCKSVQIALRFPGSRKVPLHIDGIPSAENQVVPGHEIDFEATFGIFLSTISNRSAPLVVKPNSHAVIKKFGQERGFHILRRGVLPALPDEEQVIGGPPGTAILFSPYLAHSVPTNETPTIRYALYARLFDPSKQRNTP